MKAQKSQKGRGRIWNLKLLYESPEDPRIEKDIVEIENARETFSRKYDTADKAYIRDENILMEALTDYERLSAYREPKPITYFYSLKDIDSENVIASARLSLIANRLAETDNKTVFFKVSLGTITLGMKNKLLSDSRFAHFKTFLRQVFDDAKHTLSIAEEKIMNLKVLPAYDMWIMGHEKILNLKSVVWKNKKLPIAEALQTIPKLPNPKDRLTLSRLISETLKTVAPVSEVEINAVVTDRKINDSLRGFTTPHEETVLHYRNDPKVVDGLVKLVTDNFSVAHRFYRLKGKLLKMKKLRYCDRSAKIGEIKSNFVFEDSISAIKNVFGSIDSKFAKYIEQYIADGQIDVFPRIGKRGGAYCNGSYGAPTFVLLNHTDDLRSFTTMAHELGHAFHTELSRAEGPMYMRYSTAMAETASTLFEAIALDSIFETLTDNEKIVVLHDKINDDIATIFRQIACFNFEKEIHETIRAKGYASKEELADLHNKHMAAYLGPVFKLDHDDGYMFVQWSHIRRFFYVYTYAYGSLVSKALLRKYRADKSFWKQINRFLSAGGSKSPEEILKDIGIDVHSPEFFEEGLREVEEDITRLERLVG